MPRSSRQTLLMCGQGLALLLIFYMQWAAWRQNWDQAPAGLTLNLIAGFARSIALILLSLRLVWGWPILILITLTSLADVPPMQNWSSALMIAVQVVLTCVVPAIGLALWIATARGRTWRDPLVVIGVATAVLASLIIAAFSIYSMRNIPPSAYNLVYGSVFVGLLSSVGLIFVGLRRVEGWWLLLASPFVMLAAQLTSSSSQYFASHWGIWVSVILAGLNLAQWIAGSRPRETPDPSPVA